MKPRLRQTELQLQYAQLLQPGNCPEGVYVSVSDQRDKWNGVIFVRRGYYQGSIYKFDILFPPAYPRHAPIVHFAKGSVVHPLVNPTDDRLSLSSEFPAWNSDTDHPTRLLFFIKSIFKTYTLNKLNDGLVSNNEAWRLYQLNRTVFAKLAAQCAIVSASTNTLHGRNNAAVGNHGNDVEDKTGSIRDRSSGIVFRHLSEVEMQDARRCIFGD